MSLTAPVVLILMVAPLTAAAMAWRRRAATPAAAIADWAVWHEAPRSWRERVRRAPAVLRLVALLLLVVAAAGPIRPTRRVEFTPTPARVMLLLDASGSMRAMDLVPSRFEAACRLAETLASTRPGDRIGVMVFGGRTVTLSPLTADHEALGVALRAASDSVTTLEEGTALGGAIAGAVEVLSGGADGRRGGAIVIVTDGAANEGLVTPLDAARLARSRDIVIHTVGIGGDVRAPYPTEVGVIDVSLPVNDTLLRRLAADTGGRYWRVTDERSFSDIVGGWPQALSTTTVREERHVPESRGAAFVTGAVVLLVVEAWLVSGPLRRRQV